MKLLIIILTTFLFFGFTAFSPAPTAPNTIGLKGALLTGNGTQDVIAPACSDGEILEWDSADSDGVICVTKPTGGGGSGALVGEVKEFHTFGGTLPIPSGYMIANGDVVNETNYDAIHGAGAYAADGVASSLLLNKNLPDMIGKYAVGAAATVQDGTSAITSVGNAGNQVNLNHTHSGPNHNHAWMVSQFIGNNTTYDAAGNSFDPGQYNFAGGGGSTSLDIGKSPATTYYTNNASGTTGDALSTTQSIQPESIEVIKIIKVI